jgi:hypothetical protein
MIPRNRLLLVLVSCAVAHGAVSAALAAGEAHEQTQQSVDDFRGAMLFVEQATASRLEALKHSGIRAVALALHSGVQARVAERRACRRIEQAQLDLYYWIEVARCPELADAHPAWMASLQGHSEWRRLFEDPPKPRDDEVVKTYPWVPILNKEPFQGQLARVRKLLEDRPQPKGIFLNDIQGAPSACGCGNHLCRWTTDYGKIRTATPLGNEAPAAFVAEIQKLLPHSRVIPVWTTECEQHDGAKDGLCAGVGCFKGICWRAYTEQLMPVAKRSKTLGVLLPYRAFQRDLPLYGETAGWITHAVKSFETMTVRHQGEPIGPARLIVVLQGWGVTEEQIARQVEVADSAGVAGLLISYAEIDQGWEPRLLKWK